MATRERRARELGISVDELPDNRGKHGNHYRGPRMPLEDRFWPKVDKTEECWLWTAAVDKSGYGSIGINGKIIGAHRVSYEIHHGTIPLGMHVCHSCDNPPCVNPSHLWLGTNADNMRDRNEKGRASGGRAPGELSTSAKLKEADAIAIRALCAKGAQQKDVALRYGVHKATVNDLVLRKTWRHI